MVVGTYRLLETREINGDGTVILVRTQKLHCYVNNARNDHEHRQASDERRHEQMV